MRTLCSNGRDEARAYAEMELPPPRVEPPLEMDRIAIVDPRRTPTLHLDEPPASSGPRNPEQMTPPAPEDELRVELPERLPLTAAQPVIVPPELAALWREEAKKKGEP
ncbi:MAG: hypothetical protein QM820_32405 [Minicystis sp.]